MGSIRSTREQQRYMERLTTMAKRVPASSPRAAATRETAPGPSAFAATAAATGGTAGTPSAGRTTDAFWSRAGGGVPSGGDYH